MTDSYFFIDGSALLAQIRQLQRARPVFRNRKLCPRILMNYYMVALRDLHGGSYKRAILYFPTGDETNVESFIDVPDHRQPGLIRDLHFKFCGHKLKRSAEFIEFVDTAVPAKFQDRFAKSEKGIDIEMCCDALKLASTSQVHRLFLFTNDGDFIPFCRTIKEFGTNISIIHLSSVTPPNADLLRSADSYDVVPDSVLDGLFLAGSRALEESQSSTEPPPVVQSQDLTPRSEKPASEPSDLHASGDPEGA